MTLIFVASLNENMVLANTLQAQLKALGCVSKSVSFALVITSYSIHYTKLYDFGWFVLTGIH